MDILTAVHGLTYITGLGHGALIILGVLIIILVVKALLK